MSEALQAIIDFVEGRLAAEQFEHVLYERPEFEDILKNDPSLPRDTFGGRDTYLYVISQDFRDRAGIQNVHRALTEYLQRNGIHVEPTDLFAAVQPMRIGRLRLECRDCGAWSTDPDLGDFAYGEWILRTPVADDMAFLCAFDNPVFDEVSALVKELLSETDLDPAIKSVCFQQVFGWACDLAPSGHPYDMTNIKHWCHSCGSENVRRHTDIPWTLEKFWLRIPTYKAWQRRTQDEKRELLKNALRTVGCLPGKAPPDRRPSAF